jgi:hypothetical protein
MPATLSKTRRLVVPEAALHLKNDFGIKNRAAWQKTRRKT